MDLSQVCQIGFESKWETVKDSDLKPNLFLCDNFHLLIKFFILWEQRQDPLLFLEKI